MRFPTNVLSALADPRTEIRGDQVKIPFELDRPVYEALNVVLKEMGGRWDGRKAVRAHVFPHRIEEHFAQCIAAGEYPSRYEQGWFPTPHALVMQVCDLAGIYAGMSVLEPSAGAGALTQEVAKRGGLVDAYEVDERRADILREQGDCRRVFAGDFLAQDPMEYAEGFDRIVMNPPFSNGLDHIQHAIGFMKDDGILVSVMSEGLMWRSDRKTSEFRAMVEEVGGEIEPLPADSFAVSGTNVRTCLLYLPGYAGGPLRTHDWLNRQPKQLDLFEFAA
ncbi:lambda phage type II DNA modification methyltransferase [Streptomyces inusitatus]|uniref:Lambda phage type II DNA modification methyltransferase n=1 Tax=Streptomyces inusitatus TaxID=68221 RepID=A0A918UNQ8_9ACTN|nr:methyltransferase [Streptomyces inusitatus]GGZ23497.1 lambda phage type II DNA modification methyltransferase [Streptomyces inusitatus]